MKIFRKVNNKTAKNIIRRELKEAYKRQDLISAGILKTIGKKYGVYGNE